MSEKREMREESRLEIPVGGDPLLRLEDKLADGLRFANIMGSMNQETERMNAVLLHSLIEVLIGKGVIHLHELDERKDQVFQALNQKEMQGPHVHLVDSVDKYKCGDPVAIDCEKRQPICKSVCCRLWFPLSWQDLQEKVLKWDYSRPFGIAQDEDGYCTHLDRSTQRCRVYEKRPVICRTYSCREDKRIWLDFDAMKLNPEIEKKLQVA